MTIQADLDWRDGLERLRGAFADKTLSAYAYQFAAFERWCAGAGLCALPASPETVATYLNGSFAVGFAVWTVIAQMHAIRRVHRVMRLSDPTVTDDVWIAIRRGRKDGPPARQATPINAPLKARLVAACPPTLVGLRDRAVLQLAYDMLARRSELVALRLEELELLGDGTARFRIRSGKEDPRRPGDHGYLSAEGLAALRAWLDAAQITDGHVFRTVRRGRVGDRIRQTSFLNQRIAVAAAAAGLPPAVAACLTGHSLRVGAAQDLAMAGRSILEIMRAGRWSSPHLVVQYVQKAPVHVWRGQDGDVFPLAVEAKSWRRRRLSKTRAGLDEAEEARPLRG